MTAKSTLTTAASVLATVFAIAYSELMTAKPNYGSTVHVTYWEKWTDFERDAMKVIVDKYNATEGAKKHIFVDFMPVSDIEDKTIVATSGGLPPDIAGLSTSSLAAFADNDALTPWDDLCRQYGIKKSDYIPIYWEQVFYRNHVFALPTTPASTALHYNKAEFRAAGLDPEKPPLTIEELDEDAARLTKKDENGNYTQLGFIPADPGWWNWGWGCFFGGELWNGKDKITCNSPENVRGFEWVAKYSKKYGPTAISTFKSSFVFGSATNGFISGKEAMQLQGVWTYNFISRYNPKLEWAAAPFPHPADRPDLAGMTFADTDNLVIPAGAKHAKEAFDFIAFVQRQPNMEELCLGQRKQSPLVNVSAAFWKAHPNPYIRLFADLPKLNSARIPPMLGIANEYNADLGEAFDEISLLQKTPKQALDDVQARVQTKLDHYLWILKVRDEAQH